MQHFYFIVALGVLVTLAASASLVSAFRPRNRWPYRLDEALLSPGQRAFRPVLERAVGDDYLVFAKIRAVDIIAVERRLDRRRRERARERIADDVFDFVVCARDTTTIGCALVLVPRSRLPLRARRGRLDRICAAAGLALVRIREGDVYSVAEIQGQVFAAMRRPRPAPEGSALSDRETEPLLRGLADAIVTADRRPPSGAAAVISAASGATPGGGRPSQPMPVRTEPRIAVDDDLDLDLGPEVGPLSLARDGLPGAEHPRRPRT